MNTYTIQFLVQVVNPTSGVSGRMVTVNVPAEDESAAVLEFSRVFQELVVKYARNPLLPPRRPPATHFAMASIGSSLRCADKLEDAIYGTPIGTTTPWRCTGCNTAIAHSGQPCKCTRLRPSSQTSVLTQGLAVNRTHHASGG